jgi:hypothetical protein
MTGTVDTPLRVEFARVNEAVDLARFARSLGLHARCRGTTVEIAGPLVILPSHNA